MSLKPHSSDVSSSAFSLVGTSSTGHPLRWQEPNLIFHSCLYFSHHSNSHSVSVLPHTMILYRPYSLGVQPGGYVLPSSSVMPPARPPFVTMPRLRAFSLAVQSTARSKTRS